MRKEVQFPTLREDDNFAFKPPRSKDSAMAAALKGRNAGSAINLYEAIAADAMLNTVDVLAHNNDVAQIRVFGNVAAMAAYGAALYTFGEPKQDEAGFRRVRFAQMYDPVTRHRTTTDELIEATLDNLAVAATESSYAEYRSARGLDTIKQNEYIGRSFAASAFLLAALHDGVDLRSEEGAALQNVSWQSARSLVQRADTMTKTSAHKTRPSAGGFSHEYSNLRRDMNTDPSLLPAPAYNTFTKQLEDSKISYLQILAAERAEVEAHAEAA